MIHITKFGNCRETKAFPSRVVLTLELGTLGHNLFQWENDVFIQANERFGDERLEWDPSEFLSRAEGEVVRDGKTKQTSKALRTRQFLQTTETSRGAEGNKR